MSYLDWHATLKTIQEEVAQVHFQNVLLPLQLIDIDDKSVRLGVLSNFHADRVQSFTSVIKKAIHKQTGSDLQLEFEVLIREANELASRSSGTAPTPAQSTFVPPVSLKVLQKPLHIEEAVPQELFETVEPNYPSFSNEFFICAFNQVAYQFGLLFAEKRDSNIQTLTVVSQVGMGKTHLLSEIGKAIHKKNPSLRIRYTHAEAFTGEMYQSFQSNHDSFAFKRKYRHETDVLLFDDLHLLTKRTKSQEELVHIYNEITSNGGRVLFTSSVPIHKLEEFSVPLRSRLSSSVIAEIRHPSFEERVEMLSKAAASNQMEVETPVLRILAEKGNSDVRGLIGTLIRIHLQSQLENKTLNASYLSEEGLMREIKREAVTMEEIVALVEYNFGISREELGSKSRKGNVAWARQVAMYLARRFTQLSLEQIGKNFGRDHATVCHADEKVKEAMKEQPSKRYEVEFLQKKLQMKAPVKSDGIL